MQDGWTSELRVLVGTPSGYDVRTRCIRGCTECRQGVIPGRIRHETRFVIGRATACRRSLSFCGAECHLLGTKRTNQPAPKFAGYWRTADKGQRKASTARSGIDPKRASKNAI